MFLSNVDYSLSRNSENFTEISNMSMAYELSCFRADRHENRLFGGNYVEKIVGVISLYLPVHPTRNYYSMHKLTTFS